MLRLNDKAIKRGVTLVLSQSADTAITVIRQLIEELVYNLIENAIKYNKSGGTVTVSLTKDDQFLSLTVKDTGIGIPKEDLPHIFERFYRADKSRSRTTIEGTGLGLAIVKHIAEYHHALLDVKSTPGEGTAISVRFPLK